ncbi:MAG: fibronectin type III domain-containing protein, partial [Lachnospiraceae bacterium]|nr:fibronectin type III domain-containing protein [Lachnospiraceae bacterium]
MKADEKVYTLNAEDTDLGLANIGKKDQIPEGNYGTDGYFKLVGQNIRANSDSLIIELAKREGSNIQFTVTGAANLQLAVSSNGNTNASDCILIRMDDNVELIPAGYEKSVFVVEGSEPVTVYFFNLTAGTYKLKSPEGTSHDNRGFRLFSAKVTQYPDGNIPQRPDWGKASAPKLSSVKQDGEKIVVTYDADISFDGGDYVRISMLNTKGELIESVDVTSEGKQAVAKFVPSASGEYTFMAESGRYGDVEKQSGVSDPFDFLLPLKAFEKFTVTNMGGSSVILEWSEIPEADVYQIYLQYEGSEGETIATLSKDTLSFVVNDLTIDKEYTFTVSALAPGRDNDHPRSSFASVKKIVRDRVDRTWVFAYFGQSVNGSRNIIEDLNEDAFTFKLKSCTVNEDGSIKDKGGKFTSFYDGISYYYTEIDAAKENFELTATFTIDYINPTPDGQEGFGLVIRDSIGENGVSNNNFETNSVSLIATKFESTQDGTKYSMKDGLGVRFTYGLTPENIADGTMSTKGICKMTPCQYESGNLINPGDTYTLTIKKTNTGYHCIYNGEEYILYGVEKLLAVDPEHVYVGFAVARGCNVSVSDVKFSTSDVATDPPAEPEPDPKYNVGITIVSPESSGSTDYVLRFRANADGTARVTDAMVNSLAEGLVCKANEICETTISIKDGTNNVIVYFTPTEG